MSQPGSPPQASALEPVAVIGGTDDLGLGLALRWAAAGVQVLIGSRDAARAKEAAQKAKLQLEQSRGSAQGGADSAAPEISVAGLENSEAAAQAATVILSVPFPAQAAILKSIRSALGNCTVVDTTVPLAATVGGKATRLLGVWQGSAAEQARELIPQQIPVVAAFHNVSAAALQELPASLDCDILLCGDDPLAKQRLFPLVRLIPGLRPLDAGPLEMARIAESLTALLIGMNRRYKIAGSGLRITGLPVQHA